jgi:hypothetical protein
MLVVPLFHVHPEADHRHGEAGHAHGGMAHAVWSPDLDCEADHHPSSDRTDTSTLDDGGDLAQVLHVGDRHVEFSVSLLNDSADRKSLKLRSTLGLGFSPVAAPDAERFVRMVWTTASGRRPVPLLHARTPRAPPDLLI